MEEENDYVLLSRIQHFVFCRRQWGLIELENQWADNFLTYSGSLLHQKADNPYLFEKRKEVIIARSLPLVSHIHKLFGIADVVEFTKADEGVAIKKKRGLYQISPVEYKRGKEKQNNCDKLQLCAQALCLEEMFNTQISYGYIYYGELKKRIEIAIDESLRHELQKVISEILEYKQCKETPKEKYSKKCEGCSLNLICVPKLKSQHKKYLNEIYEWSECE